jgi:hypothetical protein
MTPLCRLERNVRRVDGRRLDPADAQREEAGLRSLSARARSWRTAHGRPSETEIELPERGCHVAARDHCLSLVRAVDRPTGAER